MTRRIAGGSRSALEAPGVLLGGNKCAGLIFVLAWALSAVAFDEALDWEPELQDEADLEVQAQDVRLLQRPFSRPLDAYVRPLGSDAVQHDHSVAAVTPKAASTQAAGGETSAQTEVPAAKDRIHQLQHRREALMQELAGLERDLHKAPRKAARAPTPKPRGPAMPVPPVLPRPRGGERSADSEATTTAPRRGGVFLQATAAVHSVVQRIGMDSRLTVSLCCTMLYFTLLLFLRGDASKELLKEILQDPGAADFNKASKGGRATTNSTSSQPPRECLGWLWQLLWPLCSGPERGGGAAALRIEPPTKKEGAAAALPRASGAADAACQDEKKAALWECADPVHGGLLGQAAASDDVEDSPALASEEHTTAMALQQVLQEAAIGKAAKRSQSLLWPLLHALQATSWSNLCALGVVVACQAVFGQVASVVLLKLSLQDLLDAQATSRAGETSWSAARFAVALCALSLPLAIQRFCAAWLAGRSGEIDRRLASCLRQLLLRKAELLPPCWQAGGPDAASEGASYAGRRLEPLLRVLQQAGQDGVASLCQCLASLAALLALAAWLWQAFGGAATAAFVAAALAVLVLAAVVASGGLGAALLRLRRAREDRVAFVRENLGGGLLGWAGLLAVQCAGLEEAIERRLQQLRSRELDALAGFQGCLGRLLAVLVVAPQLSRLLCLTGAAAVLGGVSDAAVMLVFVKVVLDMTVLFGKGFRSLRKVLRFYECLEHCEAYLRLPEGCVAAEQPQQAMAEDCIEPGRISLRGSFAWPSTSQPKAQQLDPQQEPGLGGETKAAPVLRNLDFTVAPGELVAIVGPPGSGKTALLLAAMGELEPVDEASVSDGGAQERRCRRPAVTRRAPMAYSPQVPMVSMISSLRENITFGSRPDEERYRASIVATAIDEELDALPGADRIPLHLWKPCAQASFLSEAMKARLALARASYSTAAAIVLDEPLAAVAAEQRCAILRSLLLGPLAKARSRLVATSSPDPVLLERCDRVVLLQAGRIVEQGRPQDVQRSDAYRCLYGHGCAPPLPHALDAKDMFEDQGQQSLQAPSLQLARHDSGRGALRTLHDKLLEEEAAREQEPPKTLRSLAELVAWLCGTGRWSNMLACVTLLFAQIAACLACELVLATWANKLTAHSPADASATGFTANLGHLKAFGYATGAAFGCWLLLWQFMAWFAQRLAKEVHEDVSHCLLRASLDWLCERLPRHAPELLLGDALQVIDQQLLMRVASCAAALCMICVPLAFLHLVLPLGVTLLSLPLYGGLWSNFMSYREAIQVLRDRQGRVQNKVDACLADVVTGARLYRVFGRAERLQEEVSRGLEEVAKVGQSAEQRLQQWMATRAMVVAGFYLSAVYILAVTMAPRIGLGTLGLCLVNAMTLGTVLEMCIETLASADAPAANAASERCSRSDMRACLERLREVAAGPAEMMPRMLASDDSFCSTRCCMVSRAACRAVGRWTVDATQPKEVKVLCGETVVFRSVGAGLSYEAVPGDSGSSESAEHRALEDALQGLLTAFTVARAAGAPKDVARPIITAVNDAVGDSLQMAEEICHGLSKELRFELRSGVAYTPGSAHEPALLGARLQLEALSLGYAGVERNVVSGLNLTVEAGARLALLGAEGSGKTTLLLGIVRLLSPRGGRLLINGVDAKDVGLLALRRVVGMVPQEPVLLSGSLRQNIDPEGCYSDGLIWEALRRTKLAELVESWSLPPPAASAGRALMRSPWSPLDNEVVLSGPGSMSRAQRQLLCLARELLRRPTLLLVDEASATMSASEKASLRLCALDRSALPSSTVIYAASAPSWQKGAASVDEVVHLDQLQA
eukprot:TRINITY_DN22992_c0_g1_i1.p1 TRINITY_DN22992_c0_g1~~TRINITY_DN22992_c0_g1_i1.p1  ORF type:complete len:1817 (-),score=426.42 TRINITY_DN22992_c0_g1_i1:145-5595(-)